MKAYNLGDHYEQKINVPPFALGPYLIRFSKTFSYEVNLASQSLHLEALLQSTF